MALFRNLNKNTDEKLVEQYQETGDTSLVGELYKRYTRFILGICMKYLRDADESEDAVMQIFEALLSKLKQHKIDNFRSWLATVARNHCLMKIRSEKKFEARHVDFDGQKHLVVESDTDLHHSGEETKEETLQALEKAIDELKDEQQICIKLFYLAEKSYIEVANETGFTLNQVKSFIQNGKRNLKIYLEKRNEQ
ncbi:MAG: sigma-70 family RNA polymerase sigma factor [Bacteroidetes bacterium]|nr:sigma-70 family RNA polymerase sigma factor [Bacteroidota bacterium]MBU1719493.1 sigma-70 family RNA polymerase sigma factor [Bacteroidota bacterium]